MKLVGRLDHPNVVRAFDADQSGGVLYIVMEYVPGQSLGQRLRERGPIAPAELIDYAAQAALGLHHAHAQGIVHRDVKPSNLLLSAEGQIKLLDLGLGVLVAADEETAFATADGIAVGTIDYMSPEQARGLEVDGRSDLYNLGCSMYHMLSGKLPFAGASPVERLGKRITGRPTPISDYRPDLPPSLVQVLDILLASRPQDRFQSGLEVAEALQGLPILAGPAPRGSLPAGPAPRRCCPSGPAPRRSSRPTGPAPRRPWPPRAAGDSAVAPAPRVPAPARPTPGVAPARPEYPGWFRPLARLAEALGRRGAARPAVPLADRPDPRLPPGPRDVRPRPRPPAAGVSLNRDAPGPPARGRIPWDSPTRTRWSARP
jgi:serine/threonine-protein kinase